MTKAVGAWQGDSAVTVDQHQFLTFTLGGEMYGISILNIKEIIEYGEVTAVPMMPSFIRGVINLRGAVVPVIDLASRFGRERSVVTRRSCIVIVEVGQGGERQDVGVMVDAVSEVLDIPSNQVEPPPAFGARIRTDFIQGMGKVNGRFVIVLNVARVLSEDELGQLGTIAAGGGMAMA